MRFLQVLVATSLVMPPAAYADADRPTAGITCGFTSLNDMTGTVEDPDRRYGEIDGGPMVVLPEQVTEPVFSTTITCSIQIESTDPAAPDVVRASATWPGNLAFLPPVPITYRRTELEWDPLCTEVTWLTRSGMHTWHYDDAPDLPGVQCSLAVSAPG